jgi:hypothetical protein
LVRSGTWSQVLCTSYALSLSFFEAVILNELTARAAPACTLLIDKEGVRSALDEYGPQHAGRMYEVEPVAVHTGCFHPKILLLANQGDAHLVIGSGNLTFSGWGRNLECFDHLHASFAAGAFREMSEFFRVLADVPWAQHAAQQACHRAAEVLDRGARSGADDGSIRVLHNLRWPLLDQFAEIASSLGGARRVIIASPYYDQVAIPEICKVLAVEHTFLHAHAAGTVEGTAANWPPNSAKIARPVRVNWIDKFSDRPLHAKLFEVLCTKGRFVVSGSANATRAGLLQGGNVEVCAVRIEQKVLSGWAYQSSQALIPQKVTPDVDESENNNHVCVLTGKLNGTSVRGRVVEPFPAGPSEVSCRAAGVWQDCGLVSIDALGCFALRLSAEASWNGGQMVLQLRATSGLLARGFLSQPEFSSVIRRLGASARSFITFLQGMDVPEDMAAILHYFQHHPEDFLEPETNSAGGNRSVPPVEQDHTLPVQEETNSDHWPQSNDGPISSKSVNAWERMIQDLIATLTNRVRRDSSEDEEEDSAEDDKAKSAQKKRKAAAEAARRKIKLGVPYLFDQIEKANPERVNIALALALLEQAAHEIKMETSLAHKYFTRLITIAARRKKWPSDQSLLQAAYVLWGLQLAIAGENGVVLRTRLYLLRCGCNLNLDEMPDVSKLSALWQAIAKTHPAEKFWREVCAATVPQEEAARYIFSRGVPSLGAFPALSKSPGWEALKGGMHSRVRVYDTLPKACLSCSRVLATRDRDQLKQHAAITHSCGYTLVCTEL